MTAVAQPTSSQARSITANWTVDDVMTEAVVSVDGTASYRSVVDLLSSGDRPVRDVDPGGGADDGRPEGQAGCR
jgi:CBS domain-containing protein